MEEMQDQGVGISQEDAGLEKHVQDNCEVNEETQEHHESNEIETNKEDDYVNHVPGPTHRRIIRRIIHEHPINHQEINIDDMDSGPECSNRMATGSMERDGLIQRRYIRRKRTPEEIIAHNMDLLKEHRNAQPQRIPGPPGKRGRRPAMYNQETEPISRNEAARRSGRPTVLHPSGVEFPIPVSVEAHPVPLSDTIPEAASYDILRDDQGMPYCSSCHCVLKSWHGLDYHIMSVHLKYRPYRCQFCVNDSFYTEEECISHIKSSHVGRPLNFIRELREDKEAEAVKYYAAMFSMIREADTLNEEKIQNIQQTSYLHMQKFHRMRFKIPEVVARQRSQRDGACQTHVTMAAPQSLHATSMKPHYSRDRDMIGAMKVVRTVNGEYVEVVHTGSRYMLDRDLDDGEPEFEGDHIDVEEHHEMQHHGGVVHY